MDENDAFNGAGSIPVEGFAENVKQEVEDHLKTLARQLHKRLGERLKILPLTLSALEAFGGDLEWVSKEN